MAETRTDAELVRRGLARSRRHAVALVAAGRVMVAGSTVSKPSTVVPPDATITVDPDPLDPGYASRAGGKLAGALDALAGDPQGRAVVAAIEGARCLDLGASTGGFTDVLLRHGAAHVTALDVGHDQMLPVLRTDPRVTVVEGFNVRDLGPGDLDRAPRIVVGDLSFISLTLVVGPVSTAVADDTDLLLLVKPQFEVGREALGSGGVVRDPAQHAQAVREVVRAAAGHGLLARAVVPSPLPGPSGNREYFCWFRPGPVPDPGAVSLEVSLEVSLDAATEAAATAAAGWQPDPVAPSIPPVLTIGATA